MKQFLMFFNDRLHVKHGKLLDIGRRGETALQYAYE